MTTNILSVMLPIRWVTLTVFLCLLIFNTSVNASNEVETYSAPTSQEWVVVLKDPRPARLQGWSNNRYRNNSHYSSADFKRIGVKFAKRNNLKLKQEWFIESLSVYCLIVEFKTDTEQTLNALKQNQSVEWVQKSNDFKLLNSDSTSVMNNSNKEMQRFQNINYDGAGTVIAMIDSGVDKQHQDLSHAIKNVANFVVTNSHATGSKSKAETHGTAIAGVLIAQPNETLGIAGIAPAAHLLAFRGCWEEISKITHCNTLSLARALDAVIKRQPDILNLSLSGPYDPLLNKLVDQVIKNRTIIVAAFDPARSNKKRFPAIREGVLIVRAENLDPQFDNAFTAPGAQIVPSPNNNYSFQTGHSIASAHASGLLALLTQARSQNPSIQSVIDMAISGKVKSSDSLLDRLRN